MIKSNEKNSKLLSSIDFSLVSQYNKIVNLAVSDGLLLDTLESELKPVLPKWKNNFEDTYKVICGGDGEANLKEDLIGFFKEDYTKLDNPTPILDVDFHEDRYPALSAFKKFFVQLDKDFEIIRCLSNFADIGSFRGPEFGYYGSEGKEKSAFYFFFEEVLNPLFDFKSRECLYSFRSNEFSFGIGALLSKDFSSLELEMDQVVNSVKHNCAPFTDSMCYGKYCLTIEDLLFLAGAISDDEFLEQLQSVYIINNGEVYTNLYLEDVDKNNISLYNLKVSTDVLSDELLVTVLHNTLSVFKENGALPRLGNGKIEENKDVISVVFETTLYKKFKELIVSESQASQRILGLLNTFWFSIFDSSEYLVEDEEDLLDLAMTTCLVMAATKDPDVQLDVDDRLMIFNNWKSNFNEMILNTDNFFCVIEGYLGINFGGNEFLSLGLLFFLLTEDSFNELVLNGTSKYLQRQFTSQSRINGTLGRYNCFHFGVNNSDGEFCELFNIDEIYLENLISYWNKEVDFEDFKDKFKNNKDLKEQLISLVPYFEKDSDEISLPNFKFYDSSSKTKFEDLALELRIDQSLPTFLDFFKESPKYFVIDLDIKSSEDDVEFDRIKSIFYRQRLSRLSDVLSNLNSQLLVVAKDDDVRGCLVSVGYDGLVFESKDDVIDYLKSLNLQILELRTDYPF